jgi:FAD/FMN-containing dehydrogenase
MPVRRGDALRPGDAGYDEARQVWNGMIDRRPALIVRAADRDDVASAVRLARDEGLVLAVRGGGHSVAGHSTCDDGIVLDLSRISDVRLDPATRRVRVGGGALLRDLDRATQEHGFVVPSGQVSHTGVGGLTLGGGTGWLMRRYGLTVDSLRSAEVVTADGEVVRTDTEHHADLFWALRGGGGNFGVVTEFEFETYPLGPEVVGGMLLYPLDRAAEVVAFCRDVMESAPDELTTFPVLITAPPHPPFPPALQGRPVLALGAVYAGTVEEGLRAVEEIRATGPALDLLGPMPYVVLQSMLDESVPHGLHHYNHSDYLAELPDAAIHTLVDLYSRVPSPRAQIITARMGGAIERVAPDATAFPHRDARYLLWIVNMWEPGEDPEPNISWGREVAAALAPYVTGAVYVNALGDEPHRVRAAYAANWDKLVDVKRRYDPGNLFRLNANVPPLSRRIASEPSSAASVSLP